MSPAEPGASETTQESTENSKGYEIRWKRPQGNGRYHYEFEISMPERRSDEPPLTGKQRRQLRRLSALTTFTGKFDNLGRDQAAVVIERLEHARREAVREVRNLDPRDERRLAARISNSPRPVIVAILIFVALVLFYWWQLQH